MLGCWKHNTSAESGRIEIYRWPARVMSPRIPVTWVDTVQITWLAMSWSLDRPGESVWKDAKIKWSKVHDLDIFPSEPRWPDGDWLWCEGKTNLFTAWETSTGSIPPWRFRQTQSQPMYLQLLWNKLYIFKGKSIMWLFSILFWHCCFRNNSSCSNVERPWRSPQAVAQLKCLINQYYSLLTAIPKYRIGTRYWWILNIKRFGLRGINVTGTSL